MTRVCHLLDDRAGFEQRVGVTQLVGHLPTEGFSLSLAATSPATSPDLIRAGCEAMAGTQTVDSLKLPSGLPLLSRYARVRTLAGKRFDLIHAWSAEAAVIARKTGDIPLVVTVFDPALARREVKMLRRVVRDRHFAVACGTELVRRRLIEQGVPAGLCVVLRSGVDFGLIDQARRSTLRGELGVLDNERLAIIPEPVTRGSGAFEAFWAVAFRAHLTGGFRVIVLGPSSEQKRIARFASRLPTVDPSVRPMPVAAFEELVSVCDVMITAPRGDIPTTAIAWAMAAGAAVIATEVPAVTEFVSHGRGGLLVKPQHGRSLIGALSRHLMDHAAQKKNVETARRRAIEMFDLRRYVTQYVTLYENVISGRSPGDRIADPVTVS